MVVAGLRARKEVKRWRRRDMVAVLRGFGVNRGVVVSMRC